jgi:4-hydroxy-3-methylbut-2-enyl diphosphate reductase
VDGAARKALSRTGAVAVDMESAWLAPAGAPFIALRAIVDTPRHPLWSVGTAARGIRALRALRRAVPALDQWATATGPREVFLAGADPQAVREVARDTELVLVLGSGSHPDSRLLADLAGQAGTPAQLVDEAGAIDLRWLAGIGRIGIITGATAPPQLANDVVACLTGLGPVTVRRTPSVGEDIRITLSREVS